MVSAVAVAVYRVTVARARWRDFQPFIRKMVDAGVFAIEAHRSGHGRTCVYVCFLFSVYICAWLGLAASTEVMQTVFVCREALCPVSSVSHGSAGCCTLTPLKCPVS